jgi:UDP-N-acetylglucosamine:LPS N-acetylglucosamine transferase
VNTPKKILIAPLDWGLGHATRCIPVIHEFLHRGCEVQIASSGSALVLLRQEFVQLKFHELVSYKARYSNRISFMLKILFQMPKFLWTIRKEHQQIEKIVRNENTDLVISDNRYGCWSSTVPSVLITHQINILMSPSWKWLEGIINFGNHQQIKKFTECWVPDSSNGITGKMTQPIRPRTKFIGMISRFQRQDIPMKREILFLISGPEPQRLIFETKIKEEIKRTGCKSYLIVKGKPEITREEGENEINHLSAIELNEIITTSQLVISRSGYTTVMDLCKLGKNAVFIPTPGQTEQEYLAKLLKARGIAFYQNQNEFDLTLALVESKKYKGFDGYPLSSNLLAQAVEELINTAI